jgi:hypothetical protein
MSTTENAQTGNDMSNAIASIDGTFMNTGLPLFSGYANKIADQSEATIRFGRKEIELAEH